MLTLEYNEDIAREVEREEIREEITKEVTEKITGQVTEKVTEQRNIEIAKNLLDILDVETIAIKTGLPIKTVLMLKDKN